MRTTQEVQYPLIGTKSSWPVFFFPVPEAFSGVLFDDDMVHDQALFRE